MIQIGCIHDCGRRSGAVFQRGNANREKRVRKYDSEQGENREGKGIEMYLVLYRRACSVRFVFLDPGVGDGEVDLLSVGFFLWQETAHQRFWNCGSSHIFVQCRAPFS
jgi:hypothetical protein